MFTSRMAFNSKRICQCCLKFLNPKDSRIQTTNKTRDIFHKFIGTTLLVGLICGKCNINLLTFDAFQKEIMRKHNVLKTEVVGKNEISEQEELFEGIVFGEAEEEEMDTYQTVTIIQQPSETKPIKEEPSTSTEQQEPATINNNNSNNDDDDDENDVIEVPQEPQVPIDLDMISDEPQEAKPKEPEQVIFKCDHCTAVSSKKEVIVQHIKQSHTFKCETCKKVYPNMDRLNSHISRVHNAAAGNKRKQALAPIKNEEQLKFRLKARPYGRPWPSVMSKSNDINWES